MLLRALLVVLLLVQAPMTILYDVDPVTGPREVDRVDPLLDDPFESVDLVSLGFMENAGQHPDPEVLYYWQGPGLSIEFLSHDSRSVDEKLTEDVAWLRTLLAEIGWT